MALYAIGDLHLSFSAEKPMDIFGPKWSDHPEKIKEGFSSITAEDTVVLCGDLSWGMSLEEAEADFRFIHDLPGHKIILKGNHDYWWNTASKMNRFFQEKGFDDFTVLHNNCVLAEGVAICGTRGWFFEEEKGDIHDHKIMLREVSRLETSLKAAGDTEKLVFLHYPPIFQQYRCEEILNMLRRYSVPSCCYGHLHGQSCRHAFGGILNETQFQLVSADHVLFKPVRLR